MATKKTDPKAGAAQGDGNGDKTGDGKTDSDKAGEAQTALATVSKGSGVGFAEIAKAAEAATDTRQLQACIVAMCTELARIHK